MIRRLRQWFFALARWVWEARRGWGSVGLVVLVLLSAIVVPRSLDDCIRYAGLTLQILGVVTVAIGLRDKRQTFERPGLVQLFRAWLRRFPRYSPEPHVISTQGVASAAGVGSAYAYGWHGLPENATIDDRLATFEKNLDTVKRLALDAQKQVQNEALKTAKRLEDERREREDAHRALNEKLENFGTSNLYFETAGVFWLIVGIVLGTVPTEVAMIIRWFH
jgi:hypothetical protein